MTLNTDGTKQLRLFYKTIILILGYLISYVRQGHCKAETFNTFVQRTYGAIALKNIQCLMQCLFWAHFSHKLKTL